MSANISVFLVCDRCGKSYGQDQQHFKAFTHRLNAKKEGWGRWRAIDFCPNCKKKNFNKNNQCKTTH
tara:strand:+ start:169 stop:369 length:201 start_codon:yes stop_codon:yes gene_type:complete